MASSFATPYVGRFAPSPTGPLHFGSLATAVASYLDARHCGGQWLVRMEDIDPPREMPGAADRILRQLEAHGLNWDGAVVYQSRRSKAYDEAIGYLREHHLAYPCYCSRQQLKERGGLHSFRCIHDGEPEEPHALRLAVADDSEIRFEDLFQGHQQQQIKYEVGDFVLLRKDHLYAYQLAVVVDDAFQNINHIIRGSDLLDSTARQIYLQQLLGLPHHVYGHLPVAINDDGQKLSKQNLALPIQERHASDNLWVALEWLAQSPPAELRGAPPAELLAWASINWRRDKIPHLMHRPAPAQLSLSD